MANIKQQKIILTWAVTAFSLILILVFSSWVTDNAKLLRLALVPLLGVLFWIEKRNLEGAYRNGSEHLVRVIEENSWIKIYLIIFCLTLAYVVYLSTNGEIDLRENVVTFLVITLLLLYLPMLIIRQIEIYKNAGQDT